MKETLMILAIVATTALVVAYPAHADRERWGGSGRGPGYAADIAETPGLRLTAEQFERLAAFREEHWKGLLPLLEALAEKSQVLRDLWLAHHPDQRRIEALQGETRMVRDRLVERIEAYNLAVYRMLSPGQRAKAQLFGRAHVKDSMGAGMDGGRMGGAHMEKGWMPDRRQ